MSIKVSIPSPLRSFTGGAAQAIVEARSVHDCLHALEKAYPGIKARLCEEDGSLRRFVNVYVNGEDIRFLQGAHTTLKPGDEVSIVPAIAGG